MMKYVLCYGDSNTWGASPDQLPRYEFAERWTGIVQENLKDEVHIYENGLNGRTTVFHDDVELGRNGRVGFDTVLDMNAPLDLVIIMLGTNDCKQRFSNHPAWDVALGIWSNWNCCGQWHGTDLFLFVPYESDDCRCVVRMPVSADGHSRLALGACPNYYEQSCIIWRRYYCCNLWSIYFCSGRNFACYCD